MPFESVWFGRSSAAFQKPGAELLLNQCFFRGDGACNECLPDSWRFDASAGSGCRGCDLQSKGDGPFAYGEGARLYGVQRALYAASPRGYGLPALDRAGYAGWGDSGEIFSIMAGAVIWVLVVTEYVVNSNLWFVNFCKVYFLWLTAGKHIAIICLTFEYGKSSGQGEIPDRRYSPRACMRRNWQKLMQGQRCFWICLRICFWFSSGFGEIPKPTV